jgi:hypothetical protein
MLQRGIGSDDLTALEDLVCPGVLLSGPRWQIHLARALVEHRRNQQVGTEHKLVFYFVASL